MSRESSEYTVLHCVASLSHSQHHLSSHPRRCLHLLQQQRLLPPATWNDASAGAYLNTTASPRSLHSLFRVASPPSSLVSQPRAASASSASMPDAITQYAVPLSSTNRFVLVSQYGLLSVFHLKSRDFIASKQLVLPSSSSLSLPPSMPPWGMARPRKRRQRVPFAPADSFEIEAMDWLWPNVVACGDLTLLGGAPGMGKSQVAIYAAATVSRGGTWPDGSEARRGSVILCETEDRPGQALRPRLEAAGVDLAASRSASTWISARAWLRSPHKPKPCRTCACWCSRRS